MLKNITIKNIDEIKIASNINIKSLSINYIKFYESINNIDNNIISEINKLLHNIGMRDNLLGYNCYLEGIVYSLTRENKYDRKYMYHLYERVNSKYNKNIYAIEREMRYAKESSWKYNSHVYIEKILGYSFNYKNNVPTNMELILILAECIRITIGF